MERRLHIPDRTAPNTSRTVASLGSVLGFMRLIWAVDHGLQRSSKRMAAVLGLTGPQRLVLRILGRADGLTPGGLAEVLHLHPSTLTGILQRLGERGAIRRELDARDSRRTLLFLTPQGRKLALSVKGTVENAVKRVLARSSHERIAEASLLLEAVARSLSRISMGRAPEIRGARSRRRAASVRTSTRAI